MNALEKGMASFVGRQGLGVLAGVTKGVPEMPMELRANGVRGAFLRERRDRARIGLRGARGVALPRALIARLSKAIGFGVRFVAGAVGVNW